jgi:RNA recognition motif-containing protein
LYIGKLSPKVTDDVFKSEFDRYGET